MCIYIWQCICTKASTIRGSPSDFRWHSTLYLSLTLCTRTDSAHACTNANINAANIMFHIIQLLNLPGYATGQTVTQYGTFWPSCTSIALVLALYYAYMHTYIHTQNDNTSRLYLSRAPFGSTITNSCHKFAIECMSFAS